MATISKYRALSPQMEKFETVTDVNPDNAKKLLENGDFFRSNFKAMYLYTLEENDEEVTGLVCLLKASDVPDLADKSLSPTDYGKDGIQLSPVQVVYPDHRHLPKLLAWNAGRNYAPRYQFEKDGVKHTIRALQSDLDTDAIARALVCFKNLKVLNDNGEAAAIADASASGCFAALLIANEEMDYAPKFCSGLLNYALDEE